MVGAGVCISGDGFYTALAAALDELTGQREAINRLNVFPVPDGDTGTNMMLTLQASLREMAAVRGRRNLSRMAQAAARGSLLGARGNSGVILSQLLRGVAEAFRGRAVGTAADLVRAFESAAETAYAAVIHPVEGTILTVASKAATAARRQLEGGGDVVSILQAALAGAETALAETPEQMEVLKRAGVVDAGGQGFVAMLRGCLRAVDRQGKMAIEGFDGGDVRSFHGASSVQPANGDGSGLVSIGDDAGDHGGIALAEIAYAYCTEFVLQGTGLRRELLLEQLQPLGDSLLVVGDDRVLKIHLHTNHPGQALEIACAYGELTNISIDNMREQNRRAAENPSIAKEPEPYPSLVAVVPGQGFADIFRGLGATGIVLGGQSVNPSVEQIAEVVRGQASDTVLLLPNNSNVLLAAQQAAGVSGKVVHVIPSTNVPQGLAAALSYRSVADEPDRQQAVADLVTAMSRGMAAVRSGEVTVAMRDYDDGERHVQQGQFIGLIDGVVRRADWECVPVVLRLLDDLGAAGAGVITLYYGEDVKDEEAADMCRRVREAFPGADVECYRGGQPHYPYLISVE